MKSTLDVLFSVICYYMSSYKFSSDPSHEYVKLMFSQFYKLSMPCIVTCRQLHIVMDD